MPNMRETLTYGFAAALDREDFTGGGALRMGAQRAIIEVVADMHRTRDGQPNPATSRPAEACDATALLQTLERVSPYAAAADRNVVTAARYERQALAW